MLGGETDESGEAEDQEEEPHVSWSFLVWRQPATERERLRAGIIVVVVVVVHYDWWPLQPSYASQYLPPCFSSSTTCTLRRIK